MKRWFSSKRPVPPMPDARRRCDMVFLVAVCDGEWLGVEELLHSLDTYLDCDYQVVAVDDVSTDGTYERLLERKVWTARNPHKLGLWGLDLTIRRAFFNAWRIFDAPVYVKIDPDALVIGPGLRDVLNEAFAANPGSGIAGTYRIDWNGEPRDLSYWKERLERIGRDFGEPLQLALRNGYVLGEGMQGGCYAIRAECLNRIVDLGYLDRWSHPNLVKGRQLAEDSLMVMLAYAAAFTGIDIGGPNQPFGLWDIGLPMEPEELVRQNRIVTHSMKYKDEASLAARAFFRARRAAFGLLGRQE